MCVSGLATWRGNSLLLLYNSNIMKTIGEIMNEIEHIPKCPKNGEVNLLYLIEIIKKVIWKI